MAILYEMRPRRSTPESIVKRLTVYTSGLTFSGLFWLGAILLFEKAFALLERITR